MGDSRVFSKRTYPLLKLCVYLACIIGFSLNVIASCFEYFRFATVPLYAPYIPFEQKLPYISFCGVIDDLARNGSDNEFCVSGPIKQSNVMTNCQLRNFTARRMQRISCETGFTATQAVRRSAYKCFTITAKSQVEYGILQAIGVTKEPRILYDFHLLPLDFDGASEKIMMVHAKRNIDDEYRNAKPFPVTEAGENMTIEISYEILEWLSLAHPYETNCIESSRCLNACGERYAWCDNTICFDNVTKTYHKQKLLGEGVNIQVKTLESPTIRIKYIPAQSARAFIFELSSLLGIWLAFSVHLVATTAMSYLEERRSINRLTKPRRVMSIRSWYRRILFLSKRAGFNASDLNSIMTRELNLKHNKFNYLFRAIKFLIQLLIISIFVRELTLISIDYFKYMTRSKIELHGYNVIHSYPSVTHCMDVNNWFNRTEARSRFESYDEEMTRFSNSFNLTLAQVFHATPRETEVLKGCKLRPFTLSPVISLENCDQYFSVRKIFFGEFLCYHFKPLIEFTALEKIGANSSSIFTLQLDESIVWVAHFQSIVSYGLPSKSRFLVPEGWKLSRHMKLELGYELFKYKRLPSPYSRCSLSTQTDNCMLDCLNSFNLKWLPFSIIIDRPIDRPVLNYVDMKDERVTGAVHQAESMCERVCPDPCDDSITLNRLGIKESNESSQVSLSLPDFPVYVSEAVAIFTLYNYIYQLLCSASFWIGFSFLTSLDQLKQFKSCLINKLKVDHLQLFSRVIYHLEHLVYSHIQLQKYRYNCSNSKSFRIDWRNLVMRRSKSLLISIVIIVGFSFHISFTVKDYFEYPTVKDTRLTVESNFTDLRWQICIRFDQLGLKGNYSLSDIWNSSPREDELIRECGYRGADLPSLAHLPRVLRRRLLPFVNSTSICNSILSVKKHYTLGLLCYEVTPVKEAIDTEYRLQYQVALNRMYGYLILTPDVSKYYLTLSTSQGSSFISSIFSSAQDHIPVNAICQYLLVSYSKFSISSLPYPYEMGVYNSLKQIDCVRLCVYFGLKKLGLFSSYGVAGGPMSLQHETNETLSVEIKERCSLQCQVKRTFESEEDVYLATFSYGPYESTDFRHLTGSLGLWYMSSSGMVTRTTFSPQFRLVDLVLYSGSIFSLWFGFSALQSIDLLHDKIRRKPADQEADMLSRLCNIYRIIINSPFSKTK